MGHGLRLIHINHLHLHESRAHTSIVALIDPLIVAQATPSPPMSHCADSISNTTAAAVATPCGLGCS